MDDFHEKIREAMISSLPEEIKALVDSTNYDDSFAVQLSRMNQKYIELYVKPVEEAITDLYNKIVRASIDENIDKGENKNGTEFCESLF